MHGSIKLPRTQKTKYVAVNEKGCICDSQEPRKVTLGKGSALMLRSSVDKSHCESH